GNDALGHAVERRRAGVADLHRLADAARLQEDGLALALGLDVLLALDGAFAEQAFDDEARIAGAGRHPGRLDLQLQLPDAVAAHVGITDGVDQLDELFVGLAARLLVLAADQELQVARDAGAAHLLFDDVVDVATGVLQVGVHAGDELGDILVRECRLDVVVGLDGGVKGGGQALRRREAVHAEPDRLVVFATFLPGGDLVALDQWCEHEPATGGGLVVGRLHPRPHALLDRQREAGDADHQLGGADAGWVVLDDGEPGRQLLGRTGLRRGRRAAGRRAGRVAGGNGPVGPEDCRAADARQSRRAPAGGDVEGGAVGLRF